MKLTPEIKKFILSQIKSYSKKMGIKKEIDVTLEIIPAKHKMSASNMYGVFYEQQHNEKTIDLLYLNVKALPNRKALTYTIVHELVHCKHPDMKHGRQFDRIVEDYFSF